MNFTDDPDYLALLAAAAADPTNPAPRGALADWLDDHGQPELATLMRTRGEAKRPPCVTALGYICFIDRVWTHSPNARMRGLDGELGWRLMSISKSGRFESGSWYATEAEAVRARREMFAHHRRLAKERAAKKRTT